MKRRLRKKKHLGEFKQLGFYISGRLRTKLTDDSMMQFCDWWEGACVQLKVVPTIAFWRPDYFESFLCPMLGSCSEFHRRLVRDWLDEHNSVELFWIGPLIDARYDPTFRDYELHGHPEIGRVSMFTIPAQRYWKHGRPASMNAVDAWGIGSVAMFGSPKSRMDEPDTEEPEDKYLFQELNPWALSVEDLAHPLVLEYLPQIAHSHRMLIEIVLEMARRNETSIFLSKNLTTFLHSGLDRIRTNKKERHMYGRINQGGRKLEIVSYGNLFKNLNYCPEFEYHERALRKIGLLL